MRLRGNQGRRLLRRLEHQRRATCEGSRSMKKGTRFVGLDVHKDTIAVAVAEEDGEVRSVRTIPNELDAIRRFVRKLEGPDALEVCYEAGPCGYVLYWQMTKLGVRCAV